MAYSPAEIEPRWQQYWLKNATFRSEIDPSRPKYYVLDMFPYPSGDGLHVGHPEGYTATDILARYKRMRGFNVLHPMGWDAFGLPAEQYAIKTGTHPRITTQRNIDNFRRQIQSLGFSYDWSREIDTTTPGYTRWTQWIFRKLHERGLAYQAEVPVNWCPALGTVLANEEVIDGKSEVGSHPVVRVPLVQWMLRITDYAERLLEDLETLDWPEPIKKMQRDWIGRSEGARVRFAVEGRSSTQIEVFTTRPDTLFGSTYLVLAPEHELVDAVTSDAQRTFVRDYVDRAARRGAASGLGSRIPTTSRASGRAGTPSIPPPANRSRSGSPTTCSPATGPARSWPSPATTNAIMHSRDSTACRSEKSSRGATSRRRRSPASADPRTAAFSTDSRPVQQSSA